MMERLHSLVFIGDLMLGRRVNERLARNPPEFPWGDTLQLLHQADWRCANLECVVCPPGSPRLGPERIFRFRSDPANVKALTAARISALSLANNHVLDCGSEAMCSMLSLLSSGGIAYSGAGDNLEEAAKPALSVVGGLKIGLLSFTDHPEDWQATASSPGVLYAPIGREDVRTTALVNMIQKVRGEVDILVIASHWGTNWGSTPPQEHRTFAYRLIDAGADVIFGHSPHVFRGIEIYNQRPILYSTGGFIDDYAISPLDRNDRSFLFFVELAETRIQSIWLVPSQIRECQATLARGAEAEEAASRFVSLCKDLGTIASIDGNGFPRILVN